MDQGELRRGEIGDGGREEKEDDEGKEIQVEGEKNKEVEKQEAKKRRRDCRRPRATNRSESKEENKGPGMRGQREQQQIPWTQHAPSLATACACLFSFACTGPECKGACMFV